MVRVADRVRGGDPAPRASRGRSTAGAPLGRGDVMTGTVPSADRLHYDPGSEDAERLALLEVVGRQSFPTFDEVRVESAQAGDDD